MRSNTAINTTCLSVIQTNRGHRWAAFFQLHGKKKCFPHQCPMRTPLQGSKNAFLIPMTQIMGLFYPIHIKQNGLVYINHGTTKTKNMDFFILLNTKNETYSTDPLYTYISLWASPLDHGVHFTRQIDCRKVALRVLPRA